MRRKIKTGNERILFKKIINNSLKMTNKTDKCIGSLLSLIGYSPEVFSKLKSSDKINIDVHEKNPFHGLYRSYVSSLKQLKSSERKDVRDYSDPNTNLLVRNLSNRNNNDDNPTKLVGIINLIVNHVPELKNGYFKRLKQCNGDNMLRDFEIQQLAKENSKWCKTINRFVTEFNYLYESLKQSERREFFDKTLILWEKISLENFKDDMPFEEFKKIILFEDFDNNIPFENFDNKIGDPLKFDSKTQEVKIQFSEYFSGCEKIVTMRRGKRRRLFRIQIDAFDENLNKEVDGYEFKIIVDQNDRWDLQSDNKNLIFYFKEEEKNKHSFVLPTGKVLTNAYFDDETESNGNYGKEGEECTISFKIKNKQPETYNVNERRKSKK